MKNEFALTFKDRETYIKDLKNDLITKIGLAQAAILLQKTPGREVRKRLLNPSKPKGPDNPEFSYLEHAYVSETLNFALALNWDLIVTRSERIDQEALVEGYLEVRTKEAVIRKHGFGGAKRIIANRNQTWADVFKSATSDLLKNCAARLGLGLDLYRHEEKTQEVVKEKIENKDKNIPDNNAPATEAQLNTIANMGGEFNKDMTFNQAVEKIKSLTGK
jgi:hypothetical protein